MEELSNHPLLVRLQYSESPPTASISVLEHTSPREEYTFAFLNLSSNVNRVVSAI